MVAVEGGVEGEEEEEACCSGPRGSESRMSTKVSNAWCVCACVKCVCERESRMPTKVLN